MRVFFERARGDTEQGRSFFEATQQLAMHVIVDI